MVRRRFGKTSKVIDRSLHSVDFNLAAHQPDAFLHTQNAQTRFLDPRNSSSVITNRENKLAALLRHRYVNPGGIGVAKDICQGFLKDTEDGRSLLLVENNVIERAGAPANDPGSGFKLPCLPFDCFHQSQVIQDARPQFPGDPSNGIDRTFGQFHHG